ncbi:MAG TPA: glutaredoxin domain-containing protein [Dermatophilaceae bacterium]|nr:glutaredoxin domain-containing protein [Dermatophilaceae bacterium]
MSTTPEVRTTTPEVVRPVAEVYWRPGCPYCSALRRDLSRLGVPAQWHNIWEDPDAARFVRSVNAGNETVPTVRVGSTTLTNPRPDQGATLVGITVEESPPSTLGPRWVLSWVPTAGLVIAGGTVAQGGHAGLGWTLDGLAVAAWWVTRRLRR